MKKYQDVIAGVVLFLISLVYFLLSFPIKMIYIDQVVGSRMFPQICGIVLMGLSIALVVNGLITQKKVESYPASSLDENAVCIGHEMPQSKTFLSPTIKTILVLVCFAVFVWFLDKIGFTLAACVYLFSQMLLMCDKKFTAKRVLFYLVLSIVLAIGIYYLFQDGFSLMLPKAGWL